MGETGPWGNIQVDVVPWTSFPSSVCVGEEKCLGRKLLFLLNVLAGWLRRAEIGRLLLGKCVTSCLHKH